MYTRAEYAAICSHCTNRKFDRQLGVICGLTEKIADFENECSSFQRDPKVVDKPRAAMEYEAEDGSKSGGMAGILWGGLWLAGGLIATMASDGQVLFYGAILYGGFKLVTGIASYSKG